jgi:hypothetical protein
LFYEILWWWLVSDLAAFVFCFALDSQTVAQLRLLMPFRSILKES